MARFRMLDDVQMLIIFVCIAILKKERAQQLRFTCAFIQMVRSNGENPNHKTMILNDVRICGIKMNETREWKGTKKTTDEIRTTKPMKIRRNNWKESFALSLSAWNTQTQHSTHNTASKQNSTYREKLTKSFRVLNAVRAYGLSRFKYIHVFIHSHRLQAVARKKTNTRHNKNTPKLE